MKLHIVPGRTGIQWARAGLRTFRQQPMALSGMFFLLLAVMSVLAVVPVVGNIAALVLLPGLTLGMMAGAQQASQGKFPMPLTLFQAFRGGRKSLQAMLTLGGLYALGFLLVLGISALVDGGQFARLYLVGGSLGEEAVQREDFVLALLTSMTLYIPLSMVFWHAPALVFWHGVSPVKSLFFSMVACLRNMAAFLTYSMAWMLGSTLVGLGVVLLASVLGSPELVGFLMFPLIMLTAAIFFTSIYFTFADCFEAPTGPSS